MLASAEVRVEVVMTCEGQRQVDALQGHPVQLLLPPAPVPEGH